MNSHLHIKTSHLRIKKWNPQKEMLAFEVSDQSWLVTCLDHMACSAFTLKSVRVCVLKAKAAPGNNTAVGTTTQQCGSSHNSGYNRWVLFQSVCVYTVSATGLQPFKKQPPRWTQSNSWILTKRCQKSLNFTPLSNIVFNLTTHIRCFCTCCRDNILKMEMAQENVDKLLMLPDRACDMEQTPAALNQHNVLKNFLNTVCVMWLHIVVFFPIHGLQIQHICWVQRRIYLPLSRGAQWSVVRVRQPLLLLLELASLYRPARV